MPNYTSPVAHDKETINTLKIIKYKIQLKKRKKKKEKKKEKKGTTLRLLIWSPTIILTQPE